MTRVVPVVVAALLFVPSVAAAQAPANPMQASIKSVFDMLKGNLSKTAEKVPEDVWSFKPTPEVRSFGQLIGHIADSQFGMCATAAGEKPAQSGIEKSMSTKADLTRALNDSIAYCDKVIAGMDDKRGMEVTKFFTGPSTRLGILSFNTAHSYEHYGNLVTYMRLKGIVPPSSGGN
ncbi:MAG: DinB family protein [Vicinamibacterales bacterium]